ncbi:MAG TPA: hypothetical protein VGO76_14900 [Luteibacter sp.]|nr:hypothetical protein [Luteibacter sp.]
MRYLFALCCLLAAVPSAYAGDGHGAIVYGKAGGKTPDWAIASDVPSGWTQDCCTYAKAIGVNLVLYRGEWTGEPDRVMVLNVWPRKLPTLDAEWQDDQKAYLKRDPRAKVSPLPVTNAAMACHGVLYQGADQVDDAVVFCEPDPASGIRLSWSMTIKDADPERKDLLAEFSQVAGHARYMKYEAKH